MRLKTMFTIILLVLTLIVIAFAFIYFYFGGFYAPIISIQKTGGETLVYENIKGDYKQSGAVMDRIYYSLLNREQIETYKGYGIYYDDPQKVEKSKLRSEAGCIIEKKDFEKLPSLEKKYNIRSFPSDSFITTYFPYKNKLSVIFSLMKVYPALRKYAQENGYEVDTPTMEIYDIPNKKIHYRKVIIKNSN